MKIQDLFELCYDAGYDQGHNEGYGAEDEELEDSLVFPRAEVDDYIKEM